MAKKIYSPAEKAAFKHGMAAQYNKEHPKYRYAVADKHTTYNEDGSVYGTPYHGRVTFFKTKKEAQQAVSERNRTNRIANKRVLEAVKKKKVNIYDSYDCSTSIAEMKHIVPTRDTGYQNFKDLKAAKNNKKPKRTNNKDDFSIYIDRGRPQDDFGGGWF